ncbi:MAG: hypothetical protein ABSH48_18190 [Verrucomicrobiota bacterium]
MLNTAHSRLAVSSTVFAVVGLTGAEPSAHGFVGDRFFPPTIATDDPFAMDELSLPATDKDGNSIIPDNSHLRVAAAVKNAGAQILRRPYSYNDRANFTAERSPPWRQGMDFDAGLLFVRHQRDPRTGFIKLFEKMAKFDMMNQTYY